MWLVYVFWAWHSFMNFWCGMQLSIWMWTAAFHQLKNSSSIREDSTISACSQPKRCGDIGRNQVTLSTVCSSLLNFLSWESEYGDRAQLRSWISNGRAWITREFLTIQGLWLQAAFRAVAVSFGDVISDASKNIGPVKVEREETFSCPHAKVLLYFQLRRTKSLWSRTPRLPGSVTRIQNG